MNFDLERLIIFWELRGIVVPSEQPSQIHNNVLRRVSLEVNKVSYSILYYTINDMYLLESVQKIESDPLMGTSINSLYNKEALIEVNKI